MTILPLPFIAVCTRRDGGEGQLEHSERNRAAQTGIFDLDIRISDRLFIDVCKPFASETGLRSRNVEKRINAV
jgi:hypothetical protein